MTRQQAGVSAEQLLREIVKTYDDPDMNEQIFSKYIHSLLATAPPEQAAHDQKVRAEVHESYEPMKEALSQFMKATLRIANDAAEIVTLRLPCHCDAQDGTPCTRCNVIREIRALAAPAASKPAQRAERKEPTTKP